MSDQLPLLNTDDYKPTLTGWKPVYHKTRGLIRPCTPALPGTGPQGETCRTCIHAAKIQYHDNAYHKCDLMKNLWTHGPGSDIKLKWEACDKWEARP